MIYAEIFAEAKNFFVKKIIMKEKKIYVLRTILCAVV